MLNLNRICVGAFGGMALMMPCGVALAGGGECAGMVDVILQEQTRFAFARGTNFLKDCSIKFSEDAEGFGPFEADLNASCVIGSGSSSQVSLIETQALSVQSSIEVAGQSGEELEGLGFGQSFYRIYFQTQQPTLARVSGVLSASGINDEGLAIATVTLRPVNGGPVLDVAVFDENGGVASIDEGVVLEANTEFLFEVFGDAISSEGVSTVEFDIDVCFLEVIAGDLNLDGTVAVTDLLIMLGNFGACPPEGQCIGDLNDDGAIGTTDLLVLLGNWG